MTPKLLQSGGFACVFSREAERTLHGESGCLVPFNPANATTGAASVSATHPDYDLGSVLLPLWALVSVSANWA